MGGRILVVDDSPTIRKVVSAILERNSYDTVQADDGQDALDKLNDGIGKLDLILLDFVMPRLNGYQFCRALRSHQDHKKLAVVLMSAKGDKIRGQFVQQTGAIDAITKPFDARGLIAVVEGALRKHKEGRGRPVPDADMMPEEESVADSIRPSSVSVSNDPAVRRVQAAVELGNIVARQIVPELTRVNGVPPDAAERFTSAIQRAVSPDSFRELMPVFKTFDPALASNDALSGDVAVISMAEVLQLLHLQRQSGRLTVTTRRGGEVTLYLSDGNVDLCAHKNLRGEFLIGRYLMEDGVITPEKLKVVLEKRKPEKLIGEHLILSKAATGEQIDKALQRQASELIYEVVRWQKGRFSFVMGETIPAAEKAQLGLPTGSLVMEGFRRVDEWRLIEGSFDFEDVLVQDPTAVERIAKKSKMTELERQVLDMIDGERTVRELVEELHAGSFDVSKILYQFLKSRIVRRESPEASRVDAANAGH